MSGGNISSNEALKTGVAKQSGGSALFGIPGQSFTGQSTGSPTANQIRYSILRVNYSITLTDWIFEVTTGPASDANVRIGLYRANENTQPIGAPLYDSGNISVATAFTGTKTATGLNIVLSPGLYLVGLNVDVTMSLRSALCPTPVVRTVLGANSLANTLTVSSVYGPAPDPALPWTTASNATSAFVNNVFWRWTE